jgi:glycosyltransferase involved in cell wall biosynthesis
VSLLARYVPEGELDVLLAGASVVALPYTQASQSGVGTLAIAAGVPVVVSDLGSLPELAYDSSFVFEAANARALADAIERHIDDGPTVRRAVLQHARSHFSWEHAARLTSELYRELVTRNGSPTVDGALRPALPRTRPRSRSETPYPGRASAVGPIPDREEVITPRRRS